MHVAHVRNSNRFEFDFQKKMDLFGRLSKCDVCVCGLFFEIFGLFIILSVFDQKWLYNNAYLKQCDFFENKKCCWILKLCKVEIEICYDLNPRINFIHYPSIIRCHHNCMISIHLLLNSQDLPEFQDRVSLYYRIPGICMKWSWTVKVLQQERDRIRMIQFVESIISNTNQITACKDFGSSNKPCNLQTKIPFLEKRSFRCFTETDCVMLKHIGAQMHPM